MQQNNRSKSRLGRGLSSLLNLADEGAENVTVGGSTTSSSAPSPVGFAGKSTGENSTTGIVDLSVESIRPNPHQPRREFDESSLAALAASLKSTGLIQPIIVRKGGNGYELIAGERRLRAAKLAGLSVLPAIVKEVDSFNQAQMALVENIQRQDLNPIDRANAYRSLLDQLGLTQAELAKRLGEDRSAIAHYLRLLELAPDVCDRIRKGALSLGHGKLLAGVSDQEWQIRLSEQIEKEGLSVRALEQLLDDKTTIIPPSNKIIQSQSSAHIADLEKTLSRQLGMKVQMKWSASTKQGKMTISYTLDQFEELKARLGLSTEE